jgi:hypothetical protein
MTGHTPPQPFKASVSFENQPCNVALQGKGVNYIEVARLDTLTNVATGR